MKRSRAKAAQGFSEGSPYVRVVAFLASPRARYITGAVVAADGGRTAIYGGVFIVFDVVETR
jgi:NAD(P)-dependent dehydrogenase (short-subunit alcohol dehydrogenase family)